MCRCHPHRICVACVGGWIPRKWDHLRGAVRRGRRDRHRWPRFCGTHGTHAAAVGMYANLPYDPRRDFQPVISMATTPMVVVAKNDLPVANFREFVTYLKSNGDKLNYGSGGAGAQSHLTCAYLNNLVGA